MSMFPPKKPLRYAGEFNGAEVTLTLNSIAGELTAKFITANGQCETELRILEIKGCEVRLMLHEELALQGEGYYFIVLSDDCDECDRWPVTFAADCTITSVNSDTTAPGGKRSEC